MRGTVTEVYKLFAKQDHRIVVPVCHHNYDWQQAHCGRLLEDLKDLKVTGRRRHFFGAVVGRQEGFWNWQVIDGQQRLTTLSLLILALTKLIDDGKLSCQLALITAKVVENEVLDPDAIHHAMMDGSLVTWLQRL